MVVVVAEMAKLAVWHSVPSESIITKGIIIKYASYHIKSYENIVLVGTRVGYRYKVWAVSGTRCYKVWYKV